jgi:Icc-related predicted phosphoesterase
MKVIGLADIHGRTDFLTDLSHELADAELLFVSGDITHFGKQEDAFSVVQDIRRINSKIFVVHGNCDYPEAESYLMEEGINLHRKSIIFDTYAFAGIGGSLPCPGRTPNEHSEEEFRSHLEQLKGEIPQSMPLIFVSHQPPVDTVCDFASSGWHVGSHAVRDFILDVQPLVCFTGHIHEGVGIDFIGRTVVVNPGPLHFKGYSMLELGDKINSMKLMKGRKVLESL